MSLAVADKEFILLSATLSIPEEESSQLLSYIKENLVFIKRCWDDPDLVGVLEILLIRTF